MSLARRFGLLMSSVLLLVGLWPVWGGGSPRSIPLIVAGSFALVGIVWPRALLPVRRLWVGLGRLLGRLTTPIVLRVLYYLVVTPFSWLRRRPVADPTADSYWSTADPPSPLDRPF